MLDNLDELDSLFFGVSDEPAVEKQAPDPFGPGFSCWYEEEQIWISPEEARWRDNDLMLDENRKKKGLRAIPKNWRQRDLETHLKWLGIECKTTVGRQR